jgi:HPt (histidine-containing phosphotransfer) domain-containing protein
MQKDPAAIHKDAILMSNTQNLVDLEFATMQLGGNSQLLAKMLSKFCAEFNSTPQKVIAALAQGNIREAKLKVHTTKGLSGNIGLMALFECSKILDQQIRDDAIDPVQVEAFDTVMQDTIKCIKNLGLMAANPSTFSPFDNDVDTGQKADFINRLERNEFIDDDTLFTDINALPFNEAQKQTLKTLVEELQYAKAIDMVKQAG